MPSSSNEDTRARRRAARDAVVALAIASLQVLASLPLIGHGMPALVAAPAVHPLLRWTLVLSTLAIMVLARPVFARAWGSLRLRRADTSTLVASGSVAIFLYSTAASFAPSRLVIEGRLPDVYFESASFLLALALLGRALERDGAPGPVDRLAGRVMVGILLLAAASALAWAGLGPEPRLAQAVTTFAAVTVAACPCALALAGPVASAVAMARASRLGIRVSAGHALDRAAEVDAVAIDKTGTLAEGEPALVKLVLVRAPGAEAEAAAEEREADAILRLAAAVERGSQHAVGRAILAEAEDRELQVPEARGPVTSASGGARATIEGKDVRVGSLDWLAAEGVPIATRASEAAFGVAIEGALSVYGVVADRLREEAREAVARLHALGLRVVVLTGDHPDAARAVAAELGVDEVQADLSAQGKLEALERLSREGRRVAMCGDASADAAALAGAHLGIAASGAPQVAGTSDVTILEGGLMRVPDVIELGQQHARLVRRNVAWALGCNAALVPLAAGALRPWLGLRLPPVLASAAVALSAAGVLLGSWRWSRAAGPGH